MMRTPSFAGSHRLVGGTAWLWLSALVALGCGLETSGVSGDGNDGVDDEADGTVLPDDGDVRPEDGDVRPEDGDVEPDDGDVEPDDGEVVEPSCGNGEVEAGEECDDGNAVAGDGCENDCRWTCEGADECDDGDACNGTETCGTGHFCVAGTPPGDGTDCTTSGGEAGVCRGGICAAANCGNAFVDTGEQCDDGNTDNTDDCLSNCRTATCGDGYARTGVEQCDDGNATAGDGCENDCRWSCETASDCDDGLLCNGAETCSAAHVCTAGAPPAEGTACTTSTGAAGACRSGVCAAVGCGNGYVDLGEECDDGNSINTDACLSDCRHAFCGDGFIRTGSEDCDGAPPRSCTTSCSTTGTQACVACHWETACTPPAEVCNGLDEDCVGGPDNGFTCAVAATQTCTTTCSTTGHRTCSTACEWGTCVPPAEICNGLDDDCVGGPDNGFACIRGLTEECTTSCASTGSRICSDTCVWGGCTPPVEICNGLDDDCVGGADNTFACVLGAVRSCTTSCSSAGEQTCGGPSCEWGTCVPPVEVCNGLDDDCVGGADNTFACVQGASESCTVGACSGTRTCSASCEWGTCNLGAAPANDVCSTTVPLLTAGSLTGSTCAAADDTTWTPTTGCTASAGGRDVFYRLQLAARSEVSLVLAAAFDTLLYLRAGTCTGTQVACNDAPSTGTTGSSVQTTLDAGLYYVVVDGRNAAAFGPFTLTTTIVPVPANDTCAGAQVIPFVTTTAGGGGTVITGTLAGAADDYTGGCGDVGGRDVIYQLTTTNAQDLFITTIGSATDTVVYLRSGSAAGCATGSNIDCQSSYRGTFDPNIVMIRDNVPAGTYYIIVDGQTAAAAGTFRLEVNWTANDVEGDRCGQPYEWDPGTTEKCSATNTYGNEYASVGCSGTDRDHVYYYVVPAGASGDYLFQTCNAATLYDSVLYLRSACQNNAIAAQVSCNDDLGALCSAGNRSAISSLTGRLSPGIYYLFVDGDQQGAYCVRTTPW